MALAQFHSQIRFDKAFGVNVNVFWTTQAAAECEALRAVLAPNGVVHLVYDRPGEGVPDAGDKVAANLWRQGFTATVRRGPEPSLVCITARSQPAWQ